MKITELDREVQDFLMSSGLCCFRCVSRTNATKCCDLQRTFGEKLIENSLLIWSLWKPKHFPSLHIAGGD